MKEEMVPNFCLSCYNGPCAFKVHVIDGTAVALERNLEWAEHHPGKGRFCLKSIGLIQKTYNPNRVKAPMKRTNPIKGKGIDPAWVEISWEEALNTVASKLGDIRRKGLLDEKGLARLAISWGEDGIPSMLWGTLWAFVEAWGPVDKCFQSSQGVKCYHAQHVYGELWHRSFACNVDVRNCRYLISNMNRFASTNPGNIQKEAEAQIGGMKRVQTDPFLSVTAAKADEWLPLKPKTDSALFLALIHVLLHENDWHNTCDIPFLKNLTNSPYLVGPGGYYVREEKTKKPLIWDPVDEKAKVYDAEEIKDFALEGEFAVSGIETGPDGETVVVNKAKPSFQLLLEYTKQFTPAWASEICDVPVERIRKIGQEWIENSNIGSTITIRGRQYPWRPVATQYGKNTTNGWGGLEEEWSRHVLQVLVGALEVPGGERALGSVIGAGGLERGEDGFVHYPMHPTDREHFIWPPTDRCGSTTLTPLTGFASVDTPVMAAHHFSWMFVVNPPENWPSTTVPDMIITYRNNPVLTHSDPEVIRKAMAMIPFHVRFALDLDETTEFADILLPECIEFESVQMVTAGAGLAGLYSDTMGFLARFPIAKPRLDTMDISDIFTELAARAGILEKYNEMLNKGLALYPPIPITDTRFAFQSDKKYKAYEIYDRTLRGITSGNIGMDYLKEHGIFWASPYPIHDGLVMHPGALGWLRPWFTHQIMVDKKIRYQLPYQEQLKKTGEQLKRRLHERSIYWWDKQCDAYSALPGWHNHIIEVFGTDPQYDLWATNSKVNQYSWSGHTEVAWCNEVANQLTGHRGVLMNIETAAKRGIKDGDDVWVESAHGKIKTKAELIQGIRPDTLMILGQHGHYNKPVSKDLNKPDINILAPLNIDITCEDGSTSDHVRVKVYKA